MRWQLQGRGWISPLQFVPIAEESDLIHPLGEFALMQGCRQAKDKAGYATLRIAVNVSARQFRNPGFAKVVKRALHVAGLDPGRLDLELTERVLIEKTRRGARNSQTSKSSGHARRTRRR
jgi:EAL domain-containing protein (putative c-di-GMP-specific phosphodiesterase class I)